MSVDRPEPSLLEVMAALTHHRPYPTADTREQWARQIRADAEALIAASKEP